MDFTHNFTATEEKYSVKLTIFRFSDFRPKIDFFAFFRGFQRREAAFQWRSRWARSALSREAAQAPKALARSAKEVAKRPKVPKALWARSAQAAARLLSGAAAGREAP